ncbi:MAG: RDD family protein [Gammaproteobacteria bacterium]
MSTENPYSPPSAELADSAPGELASRWRRFFGSLIDGLLIGVITIPLVLMTGYFERASTASQTLLETALMGIAGLAIFLALNGYLLSTKGQTIGKLLVRTQIVSFDDGRLLPLAKLIGLRYVPLWVVGQVPVVGQIASLVDALFIFRSDKRCVHDLIANTKVVNYRPAG